MNAPLSNRPLIVVLQHAECEPLGTLEPTLAAACDLDVLPAHREHAAYRRAVDEYVRSRAYDALIALGGPVSVYQRRDVEFMDDSLELLRVSLHGDVPVLGICLGAQMLAHCLGGRVWPGHTLGLRPEIGWFPVELTPRGIVDPAFHGFSTLHPVFQWHGDTFDLPDHAWRLATGDLYRNQAFRHGRWAYGLQFHLEVTAQMVGEWVEVYSDELEALGHVDRAQLVELAERRAPELEAPVRVLAERFLALIRLARGEEERLGPDDPGVPSATAPTCPSTSPT